MDNKQSVLEFDVLGLKVKLRDSETPQGVSPKDIIDLVTKESNKILDKNPGLNSGQVAVLVALQLASERLTIEKQYQSDIEKFEQVASSALQYIEEVSPTTI